MIGVYDSGLGGLTVLAALRAAGVTADVLYFADQAHVPYGDKSDAELHALLSENLRWLARNGADAVVMGCNTSCAVAGRFGWPATTFAHPIQDLIVNTAHAFAALPYRRVAVVATAATVRSHAYANAIARTAPQAVVVEIAAPALVPLVESGEIETPAARSAVAAVVSALREEPEALVYGCTHYPLLDAQFAALLPRTARIDPAREQARATVALGLAPGSGATRYVTNGEPAAFERNVRRWTGDAAAIVSGPAEMSAAG